MGKLAALKEGLEKAVKTLDMSQAARMRRASEQGYMVDMPLYHGTASDVAAFDLARGGATSGSPVGQLGVSVAVSPDVADGFARQAAKSQSGQGANTIPLMHRAERPGVIDLDGTETNQEVAATVRQAWDDGHDAIMFRNYTTPDGQKGKSFILVKDPSQLRSPNAAFDPAQKESSNLLAQFAPIATGTGLAALGLSPDETQAADMSLSEEWAQKLNPAPLNERGVPITGEIRATPFPGLMALGEALRKVDTPVGPLFGGAADYLGKLGGGEEVTYMDRLGAALDVVP